MGKFRTILKGQSKGKRWAKGQSASSNPETRKYRDQAKTRFFQVTSGPSNLTADSLKKHDALQLFTEAPKIPPPVENDMETESSFGGSYSSFQSMESFASEWSDCSNMSFGRFMKTFQANSALHKEMLAILAAITEVIKQNGGTESSTDYYCSLLTTLETVYNNDEKSEAQITAVLSLLSMGVKSVPEAVLKKTFNEVAAKLLHVLKDFSSRDNNIIIKSTLAVLAANLRVQESAMWTHDTTKQIFMAMLNPFAIHSKPKWRKAGQHAAASIIKSPVFQNHNPAADKCAEFCQQILESSLGGSETVEVNAIQANQTTILHTLGLLKETIHSFSKSHIKSSCEIILRLMTLNYPLVTSCGLQVLHSLFSVESKVMNGDLYSKLITALYEYQPSNMDVQPTLAWVLVMQGAHVQMSKVDMGRGLNMVPKFIGNVTQMWLSGRPEVINGATMCIEVLLKDILGPASQQPDQLRNHQMQFDKCINLIHNCLSYQYNSAWHQILHIIGVLFDTTGANCKSMFDDILKSLAELRDSYKFSYNNELEYAVGAAVRSIGPERVLDIIPLRKSNGDLNLDRSWLLPVLKENIKRSTLNYFREQIFPLARYCQQRATELAQANNGIGAHSSELLYLQLWNLLPCFCNHPTDIKAEFKSIAKVLGVALSDRKELRLTVMAALRKLIQSVKDDNNPVDLEEISRFDKNYLPILFNIYTTKPIGSDEEGQRLAALETIKLYLSVARSELTPQLFISALERLNTTSDEPEDHFIKESILDLIRALIPYQTVENISVVYEQCVKNLPKIKNKTEQKKAYRILEVIVSGDTEGCKGFVKINKKEVQRVLRQSLETAATSSKGARLRCFTYLIKAQPKLDKDSKLINGVIPEAVLCCKDINERCRQTAYDLLNTIGELLSEHNQLDHFVSVLIAGLAGTAQLVSATILALTSALHNFQSGLGPDNLQLIVSNIVRLTGSQTREIVASCLSFLKVFVTSLPPLKVQSNLENVIKAIAGMTEDCQRHFRLKVREILDRIVRKYGADVVMHFVPAGDEVLTKRVKNLRKLNDRKKKMKNERKEETDNGTVTDFTHGKSKPNTVDDILADSDSESDHMEVQHRNQPNTWIEEDAETIVDFTDPSAVSKISATKPGQVPAMIPKKPQDKNRGFKTASDGRLVIKDDDDNDSEDGKKLKINLDSSSDSENEAATVAETLLLANRKRKRGASSVKSGGSSKYQTGGVGIHRPVSKASSVKSFGSEYKSKKAAGDVKKKGKTLDPYAYVPLKRSALNKRKSAKGAGQLKSIVKGAKRGARKGTKAKKSRKNSI